MRLKDSQTRGGIYISKKLILFSSITAMFLLSGCSSSNDNAIENIEDEKHYMETDNKREYVITFLEDGRADVAWYGKEDEPDSISYEISEEQVEVEGQDPMHKITFDDFPTHSYGLSNTNDNSFLIDETEDGIVLRDYRTSNEDKNYLKNDQNFEEPGYPATTKDDVFLVESK